MLTKQMPIPVWPWPSLLMQPVDSDESAKYIVGCLAAGPGADRENFASPETLPLDELARQYLIARGARRPVVRIPLPVSLAQAAGGLASSDAPRGKTTWSEWLERHPH
jgi:hypothetical protein